jgi:hypothetical protein
MKKSLKPAQQTEKVMTSKLTIESLKRKNFGANEFIHSDTANRLGLITMFTATIL